VALAARERLGAHVTGWDPDEHALRVALERGVLDAAAASPAEAVAGADLVVVAAPVAALPAVLEEALAAAGPDAIVTDVGSTKAAVVAAIGDPRFIGGHPLAGAEVAGVEHARADLFAGATWYLTPREDTEGLRFERLHRAVAGLGAVPTAIRPEVHDRLMAAFSHLPHVVANALVEQACDALGDEAIPVTGPSFRDMTRVAGANPPLWASIYGANREALLDALDGLLAHLRDARAVLAAGERVEAWQAGAGVRRRALLDVGLTGGPLQQVRVVVPNRPGVIADLAVTLSRAGINIHDMSLSPSPDFRSGEVALWVAEDHAGRARELVEEVAR
ncbi:MAG: prephenate dehydrogenase/arogenate dehydrogenase family protein, partial [Solirubrobacterales bacterium]|nr:prephenate dehydrogenase/arogenate dehydrogenase family protein [Solirubrobacterales bacterium]